MNARIAAIALVLSTACCRRESSTVRATKDPTPAIDASLADSAPSEPIIEAADLAQEFVEDSTAATARWGYDRADEARDVAARPHHAPFLIRGRLHSRDVLMSGYDRVSFGDPTRGLAWCFVMYITDEMKRWPADKLVLARANVVESYTPGSTGEAGLSPPRIQIDCTFLPTSP
jgi:hypothetical protein